MLSSLTRRSALVLLLSLALAGVAVAATPPTLDQTVTLTAHGGATVKTPAWNTARQEESLSIMEQLPDASLRKPYYVLVVAVESLPKQEGGVPWEKVRDNIVAAAEKKGRTLSLTLGDPFTGASGFDGRSMAGLAKTGADSAVMVHLIGLVKDGRLLTVSVVTAAEFDGGGAVAEAVAATAVVGAP